MLISFNVPIRMYSPSHPLSPPPRSQDEEIIGVRRLLWKNHDENECHDIISIRLSKLLMLFIRVLYIYASRSSAIFLFCILQSIDENDEKI